MPWNQRSQSQNIGFARVSSLLFSCQRTNACRDRITLFGIQVKGINRGEVDAPCRPFGLGPIYRSTLDLRLGLSHAAPDRGRVGWLRVASFPEVQFSEGLLGAKARIDSSAAYAALKRRSSTSLRAFRWAEDPLRVRGQSKDQRQGRRQEQSQRQRAGAPALHRQFYTSGSV